MGEKTSQREKSTLTPINLRPQTALPKELAFTDESPLMSSNDSSITKEELSCTWKRFFFFFFHNIYTNRVVAMNWNKKILHPEAFEIWKNQSISNSVRLIHKLTFVMMVMTTSSDRYEQDEQTLKRQSSSMATVGSACAEGGKEKLPRKNDIPVMPLPWRMLEIMVI